MDKAQNGTRLRVTVALEHDQLMHFDPCAKGRQLLGRDRRSGAVNALRLAKLFRYEE
jgi:hypothetical protein